MGWKWEYHTADGNRIIIIISSRYAFRYLLTFFPEDHLSPSLIIPSEIPVSQWLYFQFVSVRIWFYSFVDTFFFQHLLSFERYFWKQFILTLGYRYSRQFWHGIDPFDGVLSLPLSPFHNNYDVIHSAQWFCHLSKSHHTFYATCSQHDTEWVQIKHNRY